MYVRIKTDLVTCVLSSVCHVYMYVQRLERNNKSILIVLAEGLIFSSLFFKYDIYVYL